MSRMLPLVLGCVVLLGLVVASVMAPEHLGSFQPDLKHATPIEMPPFGADERGRPLLAYVLQGARVVAVPSVVAGVLVAALSIVGGLLRCMGFARLDRAMSGFSEVVGALPRMVVVLVVALVLPRDLRSLMPLALVWALLAAPGAMDEAALVAERLGGARFVEALRAHGYGPWRIFGVHLVGLNLRPVVVRQATEVMMQVVFLEIALSYLAAADRRPSFTHPDDLRSIADLLKMGYPYLVVNMPTGHALWVGLAFIALIALMSVSVTYAARPR